jgi:hypothetical protein
MHTGGRRPRNETRAYRDAQPGFKVRLSAPDLPWVGTVAPFWIGANTPTAISTHHNPSTSR